MKLQLTLVTIIQNERILLGMKKRGFGRGKWNGFGGKVGEGETGEEAAIRECEEEVGLTPIDLQRKGVLEFTYANDPVVREVHLFVAQSFTGEPQETEEMKPRWFSFEEIPYKDMWPDDELWLPLIIKGEDVCGRFTFSGDGAIEAYSLRQAE